MWSGVRTASAQTDPTSARRKKGGVPLIWVVLKSWQRKDYFAS